ncbi:MAG: 4Fe-4S dicluster domain-containing protein [Planctomycetota bacterium]
MEDLSKKFSLERCTSCGACTRVCPFVPGMDLAPGATVERVLAGDLDEVFRRRGIWLCSSCGACTRECPVGIDVLGMLEALRREAYRRGLLGDRAIAKFHELFARDAFQRGRVREGRTVLAVRIRYGGVFPRGGLGLALLVKGKLGKVFGGRTAWGPP